MTMNEMGILADSESICQFLSYTRLIFAGKVEKTDFIDRKNVTRHDDTSREEIFEGKREPRIWPWKIIKIME